MKRLVSLGAAVLCAFSLSAAADSTIVIKNKSGWDLYEIYFAPASQDTWGEDHLGDEILEQGDSLTLTGVGKGRWDIRLVDEDGDECVLSDVHITASETWTVTEDQLLGCQAATE